MNNLTGAARRVTRNFDQFSVICVFGSVVGCVVLPLMIQSMESFIITFLVLCLTAKPLKGHLFPSGNPQEHERRRSRDRDENKKTKKSGPKKKAPVQVMVSSDQVHRMREEDLQKQEQQRLEDRERRLEEKREKKARKKEERLQRREEEKKEKEKEEQARRERQEARLLKKKEEKEKKQKTSPFVIPTRENIQAIVSSFKPLRRERKHSNSSSASSISAHSTSCHPPRFQHHGNKQGSNRRHAAPFRALSDPELSVTARTSPASVGKNWQPAPQTLPSTLGSQWYTDIANRTYPSLPVVTSSATVSQPLLFPQGSYFYPVATPPQQQAPPTSQTNTCWSVPPAGCAGNNDTPSQVGESLQYLVPQAAWLPVSGGPQGGSVRNFSPAPGTGMAQQLSRSTEGGVNGVPSSSSLLPSMNYDPTIFNSGFGSTGVVGHHGNSSCYSLFSTGGGSDPTPFSAVGGLLNLDTSTDHMRHQPVSTGSPLSVNSDASDNMNWLMCEQSSLQANQPDQQNGRHVEIIGPAAAGQEVVAALNEEGRQYDEWPNI